jgi:hypothetical protein
MLLGQAGNTVFKNTASPHTAAGIDTFSYTGMESIPSLVQVATYALIQWNSGIALMYPSTYLYLCSLERMNAYF